MKRSVSSLRTPFVVLLMLCSTTQLWADYASSIQALSPLGYWRFDESTTSPALNKVANSGSLGSIADGYVVLNVDKGQPGIVGNSVRINGGAVGTCGPKVDIPWNAALNPSYPISIEFWTKANSISGGDATGLCPLSSVNPTSQGGANRSGWLFYVNTAGHIEWRLGALSGYAGILPTPNNTLVVGNWYHVVGTYDGSVMRLYINGAFSVSTNPPTLPNWVQNSQMPVRIGGTCLNGTYSPSSTRPAIFGANGIAGNRGYDGWVDEVALYNTVLSAATIKAHYDAATTNNAGYGPQISADNPVGYWRFEEPAATAPDRSLLPIAANIGSATGADGTNEWGNLAGQPGAGYAGFGVGNKSVFIDGNNGSIGLPDAPGLHFSGPITMAAWIKPTQKNFYRDIIAQGLDAARAENFLRISMSDDGNNGGTLNNYYEVGVSDGVNYYDSAIIPMPDGDLGNWVFVAGTYDGANWNIYRNGALAASVPSTHGALNITNRWSIGSRSNPNPAANPAVDVNFFGAQGLRFGGNIDEPVIFNTALSATDINNLYNAAQVPPVITRAVQNPGTVFAGSSVAFSVWAEGSPTLTYLWLSNGVPTGTTTTNYTANNLQVGSQNIAVAVINPYGSATSSVAFTVVAAPPSFTQQPVSVSRYAGRPYSFTVAVAGSAPISLQWKTNGVAIAGATSTTYSSTATTPGTVTFTCTASNQTGVVVDSSPATLTTVAAPGAGTYAAAIFADNPTAYWRLGESSGSVAHDYFGGKDGAYSAASLGQPGYSALDSDTAVAFSGVNSLVANIDGTPATGVNYQGHVNFTIEAWVNGSPGQADESTVIAKGIGASGTTANEQFSLDVATSPFTGESAYHFYTRGGGNSIYETFADVGPNGAWQHVVGVYDDQNVFGGGAKLYLFVNAGDPRGTPGDVRPSGLRPSSSVVSIGSKRLGNDPNYAGTFSGTIDEVAVYPYALSQNQISNHYAIANGPSTRPTITKQPVSVTVYETFSTKFVVEAFGTQPLLYQWKKDGVDLVDGPTITGSNDRQLILGAHPPGVATTDAGTYTCTINNTVGPQVTTAPATLTVLQAPTRAVNIPGNVLHLTFNGTLNDISGRGNNGTGMRIRKIPPTVGSTNVVSPAPAPTADVHDFYYTDGPNTGLPKALHYGTATTNGGNSAVTNSYFVALGDKPDLRFSSNVSFSVAYWARFPAFNGVGDLGDLPFLCSAPTSYGAPGFTFAPSYQLGSWSYSLNGNVQLYGHDFLLDDGLWHHIAHTFDRTGFATTYIDGNLVDTRADTAAGDLDHGTPVNIGQDPTGTYPEEGYYDISNMGIWRRALSKTEVEGLYLSDNLGFNFVDITPSLVAGPGPNQVTIRWSAGTLQQATSVNGPFTDVPGAASPYTITASGSNFYRTRY